MSIIFNGRCFVALVLSQVLQDQYMAVKLRHVPSSEVLKPQIELLAEENWPPGSDFTMHVLVHLLHDYIAHLKQ